MSADELSVSLDATAVPDTPYGAGQYTVELARALGSLETCRLTAVTRRADGARWRELVGDGRVLPKAPRRRSARLVWEELRLQKVLLRAEGPRVEVHHGPHYTMPRHCRLPCVVTVHDCTFIEHPEWHERTKVAVFVRALRIAARHADVVVCPSEATAERFVALCRPVATVRVIAHGIDHARFSSTEPAAGSDLAALRRLGVTEPYLLHVGTIEPRKDLASLLRAFEHLAGREDELELVLAGRNGWGIAAFEELLSASPFVGRVRRLGYVADDDVAALLRRAGAVAYPSLEEGFGLPALEALACGAPLVTTAGTVMAEVSGGAALLVAPSSPGELADALALALCGGPEVERRRLAGIGVAASFTWAASASAHLEAYRSALAR